jgi:hypothetical protein
MKALEAPEFLTFYVLVQQSSTSLYFTTTGSGTSASTGITYGTGFFSTRDDAEKARTVALLADKTGNIFHIFELEFPNPAHKPG